MIPDTVLVWTKRGYQNIANCHVGDEVISYNPIRGCTEKDSIESIETEWKQQGLLGIRHSYASLMMTPDHPLLIINPRTKELDQISIDDLFMNSFGIKKRILTNKIFEPGAQRYSLDDIAWSARLAVSFSRYRHPPLYSDVIHEYIDDITGIEAQTWLETFFHWNILRPNTNFMKTCLLRSSFIKDMLYHVAPRAGVGTWYGSYVTRANRFKIPTQAFSITPETDVLPQKLNWCADRHEGVLYNISTRNGNFLAKFRTSTIPIACNKKEK